jgi:hypothetical protein
MAAKRVEKKAEPEGAPRRPKLSTEIQSPTVAFVQRQYFEGKNAISPLEVKNETVQVHRFLTEPARVSMSMGLTLNLGNFESCRLDVSLLVPCYREEVEGAYAYAREWVETRVQAEAQAVRTTKPGLF